MPQFRIHQLDPILANQIAAGEVVERPASVVKELVENSIDAGASRILLEIEKGGTRLIRVQDNGKGIYVEDMTLALSRHATSKITSHDDLVAISSLGFRGEALASISSISQLSLTSRWHKADSAFLAEAEGREMAVSLTAAGLNEGTVVEVRNLFFNTPARRRFLRTEQTEFHHIEAMVYRLALSHPKIGFQLKHNGRQIKQFVAAENRAAEEKRVAKIIGREFLAKSVHFSVFHQGISIHGWLGLGSYHRSQNDGQFVFVNGRTIKDRVVNHAIREAYHDIVPQGRLAAFIIFIELEPASIDVNVHPTKHEVRFHQGRMVHDFLTQAIRQILTEGEELVPSVQLANSTPAMAPSYSDNKMSGQSGGFQAGRQSASRATFPSPPTYSNTLSSGDNIQDNAAVYHQLLSNNEDEVQLEQSLIVDSEYLLIAVEKHVFLLSLARYLRHYVTLKWQQAILRKQLQCKPLLFPDFFHFDELTTIFKKQPGIKTTQISTMVTTLKVLGFSCLFLNDKFKLLTAPCMNNNETAEQDTFFSGMDHKLIFNTAVLSAIDLLAHDSSIKPDVLLQQVMDKLSAEESFIADFVARNLLQKAAHAKQWFIKNKNPTADESCAWYQLLSIEKLNLIFAKN